MSSKLQRPDLSSLKAIKDLPERGAPYWTIIEYCRHLGIQKSHNKPIFWVARVRRKDGGYTQNQLSPALDESGWITNPDDARRQARKWFASQNITTIASDPYPVGGNQKLKYANKGPVFTVGDALRDYVEWKRLVATTSNFAVLLSLINHHIVHRLGDLPAEQVNNRVIAKFCRSVIETPPKRGNQLHKNFVAMDTLNSEQLRKRKKTINALLSILRISLRMAWENGDVETERPWRSIRRMPCADVPRHIFLTRSQCRVLIDHCREDLAHLVRAALYSGCRVSELARMRVGDVGAGVMGLYVRPGKSGRGRYVLLPSEGMSFFLNHAMGRTESDFLFRMQSGRAWDGNHKHLFKAAVVAASLPNAFVFHGLRHTYASQLVQAGTPLAVVATQLGHSNTDTVSRTYGHLCCDSIEAHLARGFAPLDANATIDDQAIDALKQDVQLGSRPLKHGCSWPKSNFALSDFTGPRN